MNGKTAASIAFVIDAERYLRLHALGDDAARVLEAYVEKLKTGEESLKEWLTPEAYLETTIH